MYREHYLFVLAKLGDKFNALLIQSSWEVDSKFIGQTEQQRRAKMDVKNSNKEKEENKLESYSSKNWYHHKSKQIDQRNTRKSLEAYLHISA